MQAIFSDEQLSAIVLSSGGHGSREEGQCAVEWLSYVAGDPFSDSPPCMRGKETLRAMAIKLNDRMPGDRRNSLEFKRALLACLSAQTSPELEQRRAFRAADWAVRECAPGALITAAGMLESAGLQTHADTLRDHAAKLRAQTPITGQKTAAAAYAAADAAAYAADYAAAAYAADATARAAAADAAAYAAADATARAAAYAAAYAADATARAVAYAAAYAAARAAAYAAAYAADATARAVAYAAAYAADAAARAAAYAAAYAADATARAVAYAAAYAADAAAYAADAAAAPDPWTGAIALLHELATMV